MKFALITGLVIVAIIFVGLITYLALLSKRVAKLENTPTVVYQVLPTATPSATISPVIKKLK